MAYEGMIAEALSINGDNNEPISAYVARPLGPGPFPA
jgi:carboxymethylenebutenolidase